MFKSSEDRESYLSRMSSLFQKYAGLESKIADMTRYRWNTELELAEIEQTIRASFLKKILSKKLARKATQSSESQQVVQMSP